MKIKTLLLFSVTLNVITQASEQKNIIAWGYSARANGKSSGDTFYQEDTFSHAVVNVGDFFGVFDGHGDQTYKNRTCDILKHNLSTFFQQANGNEQERMLTALENVEKIATKYTVNGFNKTGAMAVAAYITNDTIHITHVGDSRALCFTKSGTLNFKTQDHKFDDETLHRISVIYGENLKKHYSETNSRGQYAPRLNGLPTSRCIGNPEAKYITKTNPLGDGAITALPDYTSFPLSTKSKDKNILVIATDGLWEFVSNEEVIAFVNSAMNESIENLREKYATATPLTIKKHPNIAIRRTVHHLINKSKPESQQLSEEKFAELYRNKPWDAIAHENNISEDTIRLALNMTEKVFNATYPQNADPALGKNPMCYDLVEERYDSKTEHDEKCLLIARALRDFAVEQGSGDNILVTVIDLPQSYSLPLGQTLSKLWYFMSITKKRTLYLSFIATIMGILYCKLAQ